MRTESSEVIAQEDVAAIVFFGKLTRNGWFPRSGTVTRTVEDLGSRGAAPIVDVNLNGAGLLGALRIAPAALCECANLEIAGGETFRATGPIAPLGAGLTSGFGVGFGSIAGDESASVERASAEFEIRGLSLGLSSEAVGFSSEGAASAGRLMPAESSELATGGVGVGEVDLSA